MNLESFKFDMEGAFSSNCRVFIAPECGKHWRKQGTIQKVLFAMNN